MKKRKKDAEVCLLLSSHSPYLPFYLLLYLPLLPKIARKKKMMDKAGVLGGGDDVDLGLDPELEITRKMILQQKAEEERLAIQREK